MLKTRRVIAREVNEILRSGSREDSAVAGRPSVAHSTKKDYDWASFTDGAAYTFWATPYVSEVEKLAEAAREAKRDGKLKKAEAFGAVYKALSPGPGGWWVDVLPAPPLSARAVAEKFTKAVKAKLTNKQLAVISQKSSMYDAGHQGAWGIQGGGGRFDEHVRIDAFRGYDGDAKIYTDIRKAIAKGAREAGVRLPRR